jgi:hypothetical protein
VRPWHPPHCYAHCSTWLGSGQYGSQGATSTHSKGFTQNPEPPLSQDNHRTKHSSSPPEALLALLMCPRLPLLPSCEAMAQLPYWLSAPPPPVDEALRRVEAQCTSERQVVGDLCVGGGSVLTQQLQPG